ncbi:MAG: putative sulfate exporter family transporter [Pseudolabrys sp.]|nr:putative sulfate exporter family transporter [Pseudolabrys sp.]
MSRRRRSLAAVIPNIADAVKTYLFSRCPGVLLCGGVTLGAVLLEYGEVTIFGRAWLDGIVLAILLGTAIRTAWTPPEQFRAGIDFCAKFVLEIAVVMLGASISASAIAANGTLLICGIALVVVVTIMTTYGISRLFGLPKKLGTLLACGTAICGNSAIAAVAPIIGAHAEDVAASIAFTAVLGIIVVLALPMLIPMLGFSFTQYGVLAGLTVYAVPQVLAATAPVAPLSIQIGTLVKLVRVLMLGPVIVTLTLFYGSKLGRKPPLHRLVPWFIIGFLVLMAARSFGWVPQRILPPLASFSIVLTTAAMAALGLGVDLKKLMMVGPRVTLATLLSLAVLGAISIALIHALGIA